ncbi:MAG: hypothetical protein RML45_11650 [Acetobacteraceae bacterium]|nr:hypothetical protein [Acetobacteraceae bacterium]
MRKILLATAAGFAALVANGATPAPAYAQAAEVTGQTPQPGITAYVHRAAIRFGMVLHRTKTRMSTGDGRKIGKLRRSWTYGRVSGSAADGVSATGHDRYGARFEVRVPAGAQSGNDGSAAIVFFRRGPWLHRDADPRPSSASAPARCARSTQMYVGHFVNPVASGLSMATSGSFKLSTGARTRRATWRTSGTGSRHRP